MCNEAACIDLRKDTASPLSHQMMASSNCFNFKQALAPSETKLTHLSFVIKEK